MESRKIVACLALLALTCTSALAQEDPEAVYAKLHSATLAGNAEQVMGYSTAATKAELAAKSQAERDALIRSMAQALPRTYTITEKSIAPDGKSATLLGTGVSQLPTRAEAYLTASFRKEGEAWKVANWAWSNQKPPPAAPKPAAPAASSPAAADAAPSPQFTQKVRMLPAVAATAKPTPAPASVAVVRGSSRAYLDARVCLRQPTDRAVMACAEKYR